jgi:hypothetical protein
VQLKEIVAKTRNGGKTAASAPVPAEFEARPH